MSGLSNKAHDGPLNRKYIYLLCEYPAQISHSYSDIWQLHHGLQMSLAFSQIMLADYML